MNLNFDFWLEALTRRVLSKNTAQAEKAPAPRTDPPAAVSDQPNTKKAVYLIRPHLQTTETVPRIALSKEEAAAQGWRFRIKNRKRAKITQYRGKAAEITVPAQIGQFVINEIGARVFENSTAECIRISSAVHKIGEACCRGSAVRKIVLDAPVTEIPHSFALGCRQLSAVQLSDSVRTIGETAFAECSALNALHLSRCSRVGQGAFCKSGLREVTANGRIEFDGSAFEDTPLYNQYPLIAVPKNELCYHIAVIGRSAAKIRLPEVRITFGKHSVLNRKDAPIVLDCSKCRSVRFQPDAIVFSSSEADGKVTRKPLKIVLPKDSEPFYFADPVEVQNADGSPFSGFMTVESTGESETVYRLHISEMPELAFQPQETGVRIRTDSGRALSFAENAVRSRRLERICFETRLCGEGQLFSSFCTDLQQITWLSGFPAAKELRVYLPPSDLIGFRAHAYLLRAFSSTAKDWDEKLFHSAFFDRLFAEENHKQRQYKPYWLGEWLIRQWKNSGPPALTQQQRILLAADVLRSSPELFPNREIYRKYLLTHRRYALILCRNLPAEYAELLRAFYQEAL